MTSDNFAVAGEGASPLICFDCGSEDIKLETTIQSFQYGKVGQEVTLSAEVPVLRCGSCGFAFTGERAEEARHAAVCSHLGVQTPAEVVALRTQLGMSQAEFARLTRIGIASISRWETGALIQSAASDQFLFLLHYGDNLERLRSRERRPASSEAAVASKSSCVQAAPTRTHRNAMRSRTRALPKALVEEFRSRSWLLSSVNYA